MSQSSILNQKENFSFVPTNLQEAMSYAKLIADSDLVPVKDYKGKPGNVLIAIQMGLELGLKPLQSLQNIAVINGRPCIWGDAMLAIVKSHPDFEFIKEWQKDNIAHCTIKRKNEPEQTRSFSKDQAKIAGLLGKAGPWTTYPERMLQMRARAFCCRDVFPDALKGIHSAEESNDANSNNISNNTSLNDKLDKYKTSNVEVEVVHFDGTEKVITGLDTIIEELNNCDSLENLAEIFDSAKALYRHDKESMEKLIKAKDDRKKQLQSSEKSDNDEWLDSYDAARTFSRLPNENDDEFRTRILANKKEISNV